MLTKMKVSWAGSTLVFNGAVSNRRYVFNPVTDQYTWVEEADVAELQTRVVKQRGCRCNGEIGNDVVSEQKIFELA